MQIPSKLEDGATIKGDCFGVKLEARSATFDDFHICIRFMTEDDENWHEHRHTFSSYWLDEIIEVLQKTKAELESGSAKDNGGGYRFRKRP